MRTFLAIALFTGLALLPGCGRTVCSTKTTGSCYASATDYYDYKPANYYEPAVSEFDSGSGYYDVVSPVAKPEEPVDVKVDVITNAPPTCDPCSAWRKGLSS